MPVGYRLGLVGVAVFLLSGIGDGVWHTIFGIERNLEAALSPTHIGLFLGALLIFTTPLRAAWSSDRLGPAPSLPALLPALLSLTATTVLVSFLFLYLSAFRNPLSTQPFALAYAQQLGVASVLATNLLLVAPILLLLRRWRPPPGSATLLFGAVAFCAVATVEFAYGELVPAALLAGLAADGLVALLDRGPDRGRAHRLLGTVIPLLLWGAYFLALQLRHGIAWPAELWTGSILFASLSGLTLNLLMVSPATRAAAAEP